MVEFTGKKEEEKTSVNVFADELEKLDHDLEKEENVLSKVNQSGDRTDNSVMLQVHVSETRKIIIALREQIALCELYRERLKSR